jgi:hypothetical protein
MAVVVPPKTASNTTLIARATSLLAVASAAAVLTCVVQYRQGCEASASGSARKYARAASLEQRQQAGLNRSEYAWRRTVNGWERLRVEPTTVATERPPLHPIIVALLELLLALMALVGFSPTRS